MRARLLRPLPILLLVNAGLLFALAWLIHAPAPTRLIATRTLALPEMQKPDLAFVPPPLRAVEDFNARPLFHPSRRAIKTAPDVEARPPPALSLVGIIAQGSRRIALVKTPRAPSALTLEVGTTIEGWEVSAILPDRLVLTANSVEHEVGIVTTPARNGPQSQAVAAPRTATATRTAPQNRAPPRRQAAPRR